MFAYIPELMLALEGFSPASLVIHMGDRIAGRQPWCLSLRALNAIGLYSEFGCRQVPKSRCLSICVQA
jgi:hypothetical protein